MNIVYFMKTSLSRERVEYILKKGKRYAQGGMVIVCVSENDLRQKGQQKYAVLIPKRVVKKSVARNRLRRVIREMIKEVDVQCSEFVILCNSKSCTEESVKKAVEQVVQKIKH